MALPTPSGRPDADRQRLAQGRHAGPAGLPPGPPTTEPRRGRRTPEPQSVDGQLLPEEAAPGLRRRAVHRHPRRHAADPQESRHAAPRGGNARPHQRLSRRPGQLRPAWRAADLYPLRAGIRRAADPSGTPATARRQRPEDRPGHPPPGSRTAHRSIARRPGRPGLRLRSRVPPTGTGATGARPVQRRSCSAYRIVPSRATSAWNWTSSAGAASSSRPRSTPATPTWWTRGCDARAAAARSPRAPTATSPPCNCCRAATSC